MSTRLIFGTASLGMPYGIPLHGPLRAPNRDGAISLLHRALASGIDTFDTAPVYGDAEDLLGEAFAGTCVPRIATKIRPSPQDRGWSAFIQDSCRQSLQRLRRSSVHLVQWHNLTPHQASNPDISDGMRALKEECAAFIGASTYGIEAAKAALCCGWVEILQIEFNILNQSVLNAVLQEARSRGVAIWVRSVLLKGLLADTDDPLPASLAGASAPLEQLRRVAREQGCTLAGLALRFALGIEGIDGVLLGIDQDVYLQEALEALKAPKLPPHEVEMLEAANLGICPLTDPRTWPF